MDNDIEWRNKVNTIKHKSNAELNTYIENLKQTISEIDLMMKQANRDNSDEGIREASELEGEAKSLYNIAVEERMNRQKENGQERGRV